MSKLSKGAVVVCIINTRASEALTIGKWYELQGDSRESDDSYLIIDDNGGSWADSYSKERFVTQSEYRTMEINNILREE